MTWQDNIRRWQALPAERKLQIRREAIPLDVAQSMAFEREPVPVEKIREIVSFHSPLRADPEAGQTVSQGSALAQATPPATSKRRAASSATQS